MMRCFSVCLCSQLGHLYVTNLPVWGCAWEGVGADRGWRAAARAGWKEHKKRRPASGRVAAMGRKLLANAARAHCKSSQRTDQWCCRHCQALTHSRSRTCVPCGVRTPSSAHSAMQAAQRVGMAPGGTAFSGCRTRSITKQPRSRTKWPRSTTKQPRSIIKHAWGLLLGFSPEP